MSAAILWYLVGTLTIMQPSGSLAVPIRWSADNQEQCEGLIKRIGSGEIIGLYIINRDTRIPEPAINPGHWKLSGDAHCEAVLAAMIPPDPSNKR